MNEADAIEIVKNAIWAICVISAPAILAAMAIGTLVALFQALTQIQEMTLTFIPKILATFLAIYIAAPFIGSKIAAISSALYERAEKGFN
jgi:flagellar biosynthetic protein FliQ